jgi:hypothetical protein
VKALRTSSRCSVYQLRACSPGEWRSARSVAGQIPELGRPHIGEAVLPQPDHRTRECRGRVDGDPAALKLLHDVPAEIARRNALVLGVLASAGPPVCAPVTTRGGAVVLDDHFLRAGCAAPLAVPAQAMATWGGLAHRLEARTVTRSLSPTFRRLASPVSTTPRTEECGHLPYLIGVAGAR